VNRRLPHNRQSPITPEEQCATVLAYIRQLQVEGFYGTLTLDIHAGNILRMDQRKSILIGRGGDDGVQRNQERKAPGKSNGQQEQKASTGA